MYASIKKHFPHKNENFQVTIKKICQQLKKKFPSNYKNNFLTTLKKLPLTSKTKLFAKSSSKL